MIAPGSRQSSSSGSVVRNPVCTSVLEISLRWHGGPAQSGQRRVNVSSRQANHRCHSFNTFSRSFNLSFRLLFSFFIFSLLISGSAAQVKEEEEVLMDVHALSKRSSTSDPSALPVLFDTVSVTSNFTAESCPAFFSSFISNPTFQECLPLSVLQKLSESFFQVLRSGAFATTRVIDVTCGVNFLECSNLMETLGRDLISDSGCGADFRLRNQVVTDTYAALISYKSFYVAGCLKTDTGSYCYVDAVTNSSSPSDSYVYFLPLGNRIPGGARPTCSTCLQKTMEVFAAQAGNVTQPLHDTFIPAAQQINIGCGPSFTNATALPLGSVSSGMLAPLSIIIIFMTTFSILLGLLL